MIWTPIEQISPNLQRAVLAGEDSRFFQHNGFDWDAIQKAWDDGSEGRGKGSQGRRRLRPERLDTADAELQTRSLDHHAAARKKSLTFPRTAIFCAKGREAVYTYFLEKRPSKKRILELYLNVIEWGDGVYGAEAASRVYFKKSASDSHRATKPPSSPR